MVKRPLERLVMEPARRLGEALAAPAVRAFGNDQQNANFEAGTQQDKTIHVPLLGDFQTKGLKGGKKQIAGEGLETASYLLPYGKIAGTATKVASKVLPAAVAKLAGMAAAGAAGGYTSDVAGKLQEGTSVPEALKPGAGTALGAVLPVGAEAAGAAAGALKKGAQGLAPRLINSLIKPLAKDFSYGKNPGAAVAQAGIKANSFEDLATKISQARQSTGADLQKAAAQVPGQLASTRDDILAPFDKAITDAVSHNDQPLLNRLMQTKDALTHEFKLDNAGSIVKAGERKLEGLSYGEGVELKRRIGDLTKWTGQHTDDTTVNGALTRTYGNVKGALNDLAAKSNPAMAAQLKALNEHYANLTSAEIATKYRDVLQSRQNMINLPGKIGLAASMVAAPFTGGLTTLIGAAASIGMDKALSSPAFKTRMAAALSKAGPQDLQALEASKPGIIGKLKIAFPKEFPGDALLKTNLFKKAQSTIENAQPGLSTKDVSPKIHPEDVGTMRDVTDYVAGEYKPGSKEASKLELDASRLWEHYFPNKAMPKSLDGIANHFSRVLEKIDAKTKPILPKKKP